MKVTLRMIAKKAGVSRGTVDRVMNNRLGVRSLVRENVKKIADELGYVPHLAAKALSHSKKPIVFGIILPPKEINFFDDVIGGIDAAKNELKDLGIRFLLIHVSNKQPDETVDAINRYLELGVSGLILSVMDHPIIRSHVDIAVDKGIPVITFNSDVTASKRMCFVGQDLYQSGRVAAGLFSRILSDLSGILIVTGNMKYQAHKARVDGFINRINENDRSLQVLEIIEGYDSYNETFDKLFAAIVKYPEVKGLYLATGNVPAVIAVIERFGLKNSVHIVSNDLIPEIKDNLKKDIIDFTITQDPFLQGYKSVKVLYEYVFAGKKPESEFILMSTNIVIKENIY